MTEEPTVGKAFRITGRVQGVFYRAWTRQTALEEGLRGTVRNLPDGSVEAHLVGGVAAVEAMASRLWEGPPNSRVEGVAEVEFVEQLEGDSFEILY